MSDPTTPPTSAYAWRIDRDHLAETGGDVHDDAGTTGPHNAPETMLDALTDADGTPFRMYDDDGILYYSGRIIDPAGAHDFAPLEDFGTPNAGATEIHYQNPAGEWKAI